MNDSWTTLLDHGWIVSTLKPREFLQNRPLVLLHGLSGDENSLKSLVQNVRRNRWLISLRGILPAQDQGYAWAPAKTRDEHGFQASVQEFSQEWQNIRALLEFSSPNLDLFGFSQGAAFAALLLLNYPNWIRNLAFVSGFIPEPDPSFNPPSLAGHRIFVSHGTQDDVVPFSESERSTKYFESLGAEVIFCKSNTRHKIGAYCLQQLNDFFG